jgi:peptidoglycan/xylan/chitin deacetylase (PgdA/CDA1 family)
MSIRSTLGALRSQALCSLYRRTVRLQGRGPIVSFSFDDFPRSAYLVGGSILERYGARGTYYAAPALMDACNESGDQFRADDLDALLENGHELGSHTYGHISSRSVNCETFCGDVGQGRKAIQDLTGGEISNFAYPFGHVTLRTKRALATSVTTARGIVPGLNGPEIDLNLLRANSLYGDIQGLAKAENWIEENVRHRNWLIFYTHDVRSDPSPWGCTPALLEAVVSCALRHGCRILTIKQALGEAGVEDEPVECNTQQCIPA